MSRRRKYILRAGIAVVALVVVCALVALLWIDRIAKAAIEFAGTRALGVATTLDRVSIGILRSNSSLSGLQVANPPGFESSHFLRLEQGALDMSLGNLLNETVEIDRVTLSGIQLNLVRESEGANFRTIIDNIRQFQASQDQPEDQPGEKKFLIRVVVIRDVHVKVDLLPIGGKLTQLDVPIDLLRLENVGGESSQGENLARITSTVVRALLDAVIAKGETILPPELLDELDQTLSELQPLETLRAIRANLRERRDERDDPDRPLGPLRQRFMDRRSRRSGP